MSTRIENKIINVNVISTNQVPKLLPNELRVIPLLHPSIQRDTDGSGAGRPCVLLGEPAI